MWIGLQNILSQYFNLEFNRADGFPQTAWEKLVYSIRESTLKRTGFWLPWGAWCCSKTGWFCYFICKVLWKGLNSSLNGKISLNFEQLSAKKEQLNIEPENEYNMDEKGFLIGVLQERKRVFNKVMYEQGLLLGAIQDGNREWVTIMGCICADSSFLPPSIIY